MGEQQIVLDKSMRSVFVGNIPYEATEEKLKEIFNEVGPVLSFKLVYDRETGKPKGYGFCEYKDQETALSAMRNLNGYEIGGRMLRVDNACTEKSRLEMQSLMQGPPVQNQYGESVEPEKAPEAISKAVASLPPEQMFELMKQMKICVQNNPTEARNMLLQNPQLAYALLQAQVVMRIVDPATAVSMLHKTNPVPQPLQAAEGNNPPPPPPPPQPRPAGIPPPPINEPHWSPMARNAAPPPPPPPLPNAPPPQPYGAMNQDMDMRSIDPRMGPRVGDQDMRIPPTVPPMPPAPVMPPHRDAFAPQDHTIPPQEFMESFPRDPRAYQRDPRAGMVPPPPPPVAMPPRPVAAPGPVLPPPPPPGPQPPQLSSAISAGARLTAGIPSGATDQEKAALIMQVLQLSEEQIAMLPPEQRQSILVLKEQIAKSTHR
ncbi:cleavage stimulation factor subunit 2 isoform X2 [Nilaparvata lugens]|uniref:cleavage stimulation factor subunit 2 isoform X2 n=2 Tax=Nilaparvata lugens TaxID=108931 RepID=UPI00193CB470|nr:cleavage stimulation factor subunit 2 isoform X2 [Nilaparvata lugens]